MHKHRIKPGYEGGEYCEGNVVELTPTQHAMWHFAEWQRKDDWRDKVAWQGLTGLITSEEASLAAMSAGGRKGGKVGVIPTPESNEKRRVTMTGKKKTPEMKKNSSVSALKRWSKPGAKDRFLAKRKLWEERLKDVVWGRNTASELAIKYGVTGHSIRNWRRKFR